MKCNRCSGQCIRRGFQCNGTQRYYCKFCKRHFQEYYTYKACQPDTNTLIVKWLKVGGTLRRTAAALGIAFNTFQRRILHISSTCKNIQQDQAGDTYEVDELQTYIGNKKNIRWIISAFNRRTGKISALGFGRRNNTTLKPIINWLLKATPQRIYTDGLINYAHLIPKEIHRKKRHLLPRIERHHLNLRTHVTSLNRKTICFAKSMVHLKARLLIYCWA